VFVQIFVKNSNGFLTLQVRVNYVLVVILDPVLCLKTWNAERNVYKMLPGEEWSLLYCIFFPRRQSTDIIETFRKLPNLI
jgi:uncharacterized membrane protein YkvI